jgi:hypothetical protein
VDEWPKGRAVRIRSWLFFSCEKQRIINPSWDTLVAVITHENSSHVWASDILGAVPKQFLETLLLQRAVRFLSFFLCVSVSLSLSLIHSV